MPIFGRQAESALPTNRFRSRQSLSTNPAESTKQKNNRIQRKNTAAARETSCSSCVFLSHLIFSNIFNRYSSVKPVDPATYAADRLLPPAVLIVQVYRRMINVNGISTHVCCLTPVPGCTILVVFLCISQTSVLTGTDCTGLAYRIIRIMNLWHIIFACRNNGITLSSDTSEHSSVCHLIKPPELTVNIDSVSTPDRIIPVDFSYPVHAFQLILFNHHFEHMSIKNSKYTNYFCSNHLPTTFIGY